MEIINAINSVLNNHLYVDFILMNVACVYVLLKYVFKYKNEQFRVATNIAVGIIGCIVFSYFWGYETPRLIISMMSSVAFYQWIVKYLMNIFALSYPKQ